MLDSLLNRTKRIIKLDRLIIKDDFDNKMLITDLTQIKTATIYHFQHIAGSVNQPKESTSKWFFWSSEYGLRPDIDDNIYNNFMDLPDLTEWLTVLYQLPNHKTTGPSQIFNEMLKHLGPSINHKLWILIRAVLSLNNILTQ